MWGEFNCDGWEDDRRDIEGEVWDVPATDGEGPGMEGDTLSQ
jgi:hypothetical protein